MQMKTGLSLAHSIGRTGRNWVRLSEENQAQCGCNQGWTLTRCGANASRVRKDAGGPSRKDGAATPRKRMSAFQLGYVAYTYVAVQSAGK